MLLADPRIAAPQAPAAGGVDQRPGLVVGRILEGRPAGLRAQRLRRLALGGDAVHLGLDYCWRFGMAAEGRADHDRARGERRVAIGVAERLDRERLPLARAQDDVALEEHILRLPPIGAAVHPHEAADRSGDRAQELDAADTGIARARRDEDPARAPAAA